MQSVLLVKQMQLRVYWLAMQGVLPAVRISYVYLVLQENIYPQELVLHALILVLRVQLQQLVVIFVQILLQEILLLHLNVIVNLDIGII